MGTTDNEEKIGAIKLSKAQKQAITKIVDSPEWPAIEEWFRQRQISIAVATVTVAQDALDLHSFKGKEAESRYSVKALEKIAHDFHTEDAKKDK